MGKMGKGNILDDMSVEEINRRIKEGTLIPLHGLFKQLGLERLQGMSEKEIAEFKEGLKELRKKYQTQDSLEGLGEPADPEMEEGFRKLYRDKK